MPEVVVPLTVRDLTSDDLPSCAWWVSARDIAQLGRTLERAQRGAGTLWQLAVHGAMQSCGIGTLLIKVAEQRIRDRGLLLAEVAVEECNPRGQALYERLGYVAYGRKPEAWDQEAEDGPVERYETMCTLMSKEL